MKLQLSRQERPLSDLGKAHNIVTFTADGNDVKAVLAVTTEAVAYARAGKGPAFLVFDTYRWREHCGPNYDNHIGYRAEDEFMGWKKKDPLELIRNEILEKKIINQEQIDTLENDLNKIINEAFDFAKSSPLPDPSEVAKFIYKENATV